MPLNRGSSGESQVIGFPKTGRRRFITSIKVPMIERLTFIELRPFLENMESGNVLSKVVSIQFDDFNFVARN